MTSVTLVLQNPRFAVPPRGNTANACAYLNCFLLINFYRVGRFEDAHRLSSNEFFWFSVAALLHTFTPGPNMACCLAQSSCQGRTAGLLCLAGVLAA